MWLCIFKYSRWLKEVLSLYEANINASLICQSTDNKQSLQGTLGNNATQEDGVDELQEVFGNSLCSKTCYNQVKKLKSRLLFNGPSQFWWKENISLWERWIDQDRNIEKKKWALELKWSLYMNIGYLPMSNRKSPRVGLLTYVGTK